MTPSSTIHKQAENAAHLFKTCMARECKADRVAASQLILNPNPQP